MLQLKLYRDLLALQRHFPGPVDAVITRLQNHLYFVCEEMTPLALASPLLDDKERVTLAKVKLYSGRKREKERERERERETDRQKGRANISTD